MKFTASTPPMTNDEQVRQARTSRFGMWLFIASLSVLFAACVVGYLIVRFRLSHKIALGNIELPSVLWVSTILILLGSLTIELANRFIAKNNIIRFKQCLIWTDMLTAGFILAQIPGLSMLFKTHHQLVDSGIAMYGMVFMVILLHGLHVLGGLVPLFVINRRAMSSGYTANTAMPVRILAMYWHFLGIVWVILFSMLSLLG